MTNSKLLYRIWYYFRIGYSTYLTFPLSFVTTLVTLYYLAVTNITVLSEIFPHFLFFAIFATVAGIPLAVLIGWGHMKRSDAFKQEVAIGTESNPYNFRVTPGKEEKVYLPMNILMMKATKRHLMNELTSEERRIWDELTEKLESMLRGESIPYYRENRR